MKAVNSIWHIKGLTYGHSELNYIINNKEYKIPAGIITIETDNN